MSTPPPHPPASLATPSHDEGTRRGPTAATTALVALITLRELARRRGALALATLLPLTFYLVRLEVHWTAMTDSSRSAPSRSRGTRAATSEPRGVATVAVSSSMTGTAPGRVSSSPIVASTSPV